MENKGFAFGAGPLMYFYDSLKINIMEGNEMNNKIIDSIKGGLWGGIVGDALGVPVEFQDRKELEKNPVIYMRAYGTHNQPKGTWSDDTSMTLCLVDNLIKGYDLNEIAYNFVKWYRHGFMTPYGMAFDIGNTTRKAIYNIEAGVKVTEAGGGSKYDNGNGSLMRILPLVFYLKDEKDLDKKFKIIHDVSAITHRHNISKIACSIYIEFAINLINGYSKEEAYEKMKSVILNYYKDNQYLEDLKSLERVLKGNIRDKKLCNINSSGYVVHTLEASLWCFFNNDNYKDTVLQAVNLGDDTDTTASVVGGLAGIHYGFNDICESWINDIAKGEMIKKLIYEFCNSIK